MGGVIEIRILAPGVALDDFVAAWRDTSRGEYRERSIVAFDSWETLCSTLAEGRFELLHHIGRSTDRSVKELATALGRPEARIQEDVAILDRAGFLVGEGSRLKPAAEKLVLTILEGRST